MFDPIPEGFICQADNCDHLATDRLTDPSVIPHMATTQLLCRHCRLQSQIDYVMEQQHRIPDLERELRAAVCSRAH